MTWPGNFDRIFIHCLAFIALCCFSAQADNPPPKILFVESLRCELAENPVGVDAVQPRLSWKLANLYHRGMSQSAYQILAAYSPEQLKQNSGEIWDSGKTKSGETAHIPYAGRPLKSNERVFWKVRVWDQDGKPSAWSETANWTMGLLQDTDWQAKWIMAGKEPEDWKQIERRMPVFRREFAVKPGLRRAVIHLSGLGHYELTLNGGKVGSHLLDPGWTMYNKTVLYDSYDLTAQLRPGANALGVMLGNGMYNVQKERYNKFTGSFGSPKLIAQLHLMYEDGTSEIIASDEQWRTAPGPILFSSVYGGEDFDAREEPAGWKQPGFDASKWSAASITNGPGGTLRGLSHTAPPIEEIEVLRPVKVQKISDSVDVYDLGQNVSLIPRIAVRGPAGAKVRLLPSELIKDDGTVYRNSAAPRGAPVWYEYTLKGGETEHWFPQFFYHGARYFQVERSPAPDASELPVVEALEGVVVHAAVEPAGEFSCSNELFDRIRILIRWAQRSNMVSVLTDCPHRERLGWLEQYHLHGPSLRYEFDMDKLYAKTMLDMDDSQTSTGLVPNIAPDYVHFSGNFGDSPEWSAAVALVPWQQYIWSGDDALLREYYATMKRYVDFLSGKTVKPHLLDYGLGDWYDIGPKAPGFSQLTPKGLTATAFYFECAQIVAESAKLLGNKNDAKTYAQLAADIRAAFNTEYYDPAKGMYATGSQAAQAIPLVMNLVETKNRDEVTSALLADVRKSGLTAGDIGHRYLLRALADSGHSDMIFALHSQSDKPGYGYILNTGATALTEAWNGRRGSSHNHFMLGHITEWFYHDLAGIQPDPSSPGFGRVIINPTPVGDVTWAKASYDSIRGPIAVDWKIEGEKFELNVTIPANVTALVRIPAANAKKVTESGEPAAKAAGVKFLRMDEGRAVFAIGSGDYRFESADYSVK